MNGFRFNPPEVNVTRELCWLWGSAFGPVGRPGVGGLDPDLVIETGGRLDLLARIGARCGEAEVAATLGQPAAEKIRRHTQAAAAQELRAGAMAAKIGRIAAGHGIEAVIVKGGALLLLGATAPGGRNIGDLDVLVSRTRAKELQEALIAAGWMESDLPESSHQLSILGHPSGVAVEVHVEIPGVRLGDGNADLEEVVAEGLYESVGGAAGGCLVENRDLLLAHLVVHGIHQHGLAPQAYPMARVLADLQDLVRTREDWGRFVGGSFRWISHAVSRREAEALWIAVERLGREEDPAGLLDGDDDAGRLVRHVVAGALDDEYRKSLKLRNINRAGVDTSWGEIGKKAVFLTRGQVDAIYGRPSSGMGYVGWRLWRPFDLVVRSGRYGWAWVRQKVRGTGRG